MKVEPQSTETATSASAVAARFLGVQLGLTPRGFILAIFLLILLAGPVAESADIVASVFALSALVMTLALLCLTLVYGILLKRKMQVSLGLPHCLDSQSEIESNTAVRIFLSLSRHILPPFYLLELQAIFANGALASSRFILSGRIGEAAQLYEDLIFPHRGEWPLDRILVSFGDRLGLTRLAWEFRKEDPLGLCIISPGERPESEIPVISSCHRPGDILSDLSERHGDYFDLKQYHPSDGAKRIVWKVYAKSGELISRHPERAMTPEGQVAIFVLAEAQEDFVCAAAISYMRKLEELDLDLFVSCWGAGERNIALGASQAKQLLIESVWNIGDGTLARKDLQHLLSQTSNLLQGARLERAIIFYSPLRFRSHSNLSSLTGCCEVLTQQNITPVLIMIDPAGRSSAATDSTTPSRLLADLLFERSAQSMPQLPQLRSELLNDCARNNWESIIIN